MVLISTIRLEALSFGSSKFFQIVTPLLCYMILQEIPGFSQWIRQFIQKLNPQGDVDKAENFYRMLLGFITWKIGCDFGFLIINRGAAPWSIAFTWSGLFVYAIGMYVIYYLIGQKMIIEGKLNPFKDNYNPPLLKGRPPIWKQFLAKFFHESLNSTSANVPLRQVTIKPFLDYGAILITWPLYNVALLYTQSGEINWDPMIRFSFLSTLVFYIVNVTGFILGYNLGEFIYFRVHYLIEFLKVTTRQATRLKKVKGLWDQFDQNKDGSISFEELRQVIRALGKDPSNFELTQILEQADTDQSGTIEFNEFLSLLKSSNDNDLIRVFRKDGRQGILTQIVMTIGVQWQIIKNNTSYIRLQGFLRRYGLNNRWLLSGGLGLCFIILMEPTISGFLFNWSTTLQHRWFYEFGRLDPIHLSQVLDPSLSIPLPDIDPLTTQFTQDIIALYPQMPEVLISYQPQVSVSSFHLFP